MSLQLKIWDYLKIIENIVHTSKLMINFVSRNLLTKYKNAIVDLFQA